MSRVNPSPPAVIHLDLDGASAIYSVHGWRYPLDRDLLFESGLSNALGFLDRAGLKATLFVIAEDLKDASKHELLQDAARRGHEIASHSLTHRKLSALSRDEKRREIFESRDLISRKLGVAVQGFRAPEFDIDKESLELIDAANYSYDASVFPNSKFAQKLGVNELSESPFHPLERRSLWELPLPSHAPLPLPFHPCYSLVLGTWYFRAGLRRFRNIGAPLILLCHLTDFADPLPKNLLPNRMARLFTLSHISGERKRQRCEQMIELVSREYEFVETNTLLAWQPEMQTDSLKMVAQL